MKLLVAIVGPTAIGKTSFAIQLAQHFNTCIISADSRQFFIETNIGTAKPNPLQLSLVQHYFINYLSVTEAYDAGKFENEVLELLRQLFLQNDIVILCGGSGMYVDAVCKGFNAMPEANIQVREKLNFIFQQEGIEALQKLLQQYDEVFYHQVDLNNPQRIIRALEVSISSGKPYSTFRNHQKADRFFEVQYLGLNMERENLYNQINKRVDDMMQQGLLEEARQLEIFKHHNSLQTVGYTEMFDYLNGKTTLEEAIILIKQHTRNFAKRQITWFKKNKEIIWLQPDEVQKAIAIIEAKYN